MIDLKEARTRREEFFARGVKRFFFQNSIAGSSRRARRRREEKERKRERKSGGGGGAKGSIARTHTHTQRERERERENERGDVRLFYDKNFVRIGVICNCSSSFTQNFLEK